MDIYQRLTSISEDYLKRANAVCPVTAVENNYSIINRVHEDITPFLEENRIAWIAQGTLVKGLLTNAYKKGASFARSDWRSHSINDDNIDRYAPLLTYLQKLAEEKKATPGQISLAWVLARKPYIIPIPGTTKKERLIENAGAADVEVTKEEMKEIDNIISTIE